MRLKTRSFHRLICWSLLLAAACQPAASGTDLSPVGTAIDTPAPRPSATLRSITHTPNPVPPSPSPTPFEELDTHFCSPDFAVLPGHFVLARPIGLEDRQTVDASYRYGGTKNQTLESHHGVEFVNSAGTPVLAAADGIVVVAGDDTTRPFGPFKNFYGKLVIIRHSFPQLDVPVFTLYGHLSAVDVVVGQAVAAGEQIGKVGASGIASGSHLHFEVRVGENNYASTRNPELWLQPLAGDDGSIGGALAGYVLDSAGNPMAIPGVVIRRVMDGLADPNTAIFLDTYAPDSVNSDDAWGESFAMSDLPPGTYQISFVLGTLIRKVVEVQSGMLTLVPFCLDQ